MKRKKTDNLTLTFTDWGGAVLLERKLTSVPLTEKVVLALSIEFFSDPEPCMIHRSAVMSRMYMEMMEYFTAALQNGVCEHPLASLPARIASFPSLTGWQKVTVMLI